MLVATEAEADGDAEARGRHVMGDDRDRQIILSRRARFVAAALAGAGLALAACDTEPTVCLSVIGPQGGAAGAAGGTAGEAGMAGGGGTGGPGAAGGGG
jgi:hypothetical protein